MMESHRSPGANLDVIVLSIELVCFSMFQPPMKASLGWSDCFDVMFSSYSGSFCVSKREPDRRPNRSDDQGGLSIDGLKLWFVKTTQFAFNMDTSWQQTKPRCFYFQLFGCVQQGILWTIVDPRFKGWSFLQECKIDRKTIIRQSGVRFSLSRS